MTATLDIIEGARYREVTGSVAEITRTAIVTGVTGIAGADSMLREALDDDDIPAPGSEHPIESELFLEERIPRPLGLGIVNVELIYRRPAGGGLDIPPGYAFIMRGGSAVEQIETVVDRFGNEITVAYNEHELGGKIHPLVAAEQLSLGELNVGSADPTIVHRTWTNTVNTGTFFFDVVAAPRTWLITDISFELVNAAAQPFPLWNFTYELRKRPQIIQGIVGGWDPQVVYEAEDGTIPADLEAGVGYKTVEWHVPLDFAFLFGA
jgi:hypothetical protein